MVFCFDGTKLVKIFVICKKIKEKKQEGEGFDLNLGQIGPSGQIA